MVEDVTNPAFLGESLPTLYTLVTVKKKKREPTIIAKDKAPKYVVSFFEMIQYVLFFHSRNMYLDTRFCPA